MRQYRIAAVVLLCFALTACANGSDILFKSFRFDQAGSTSAKKCAVQGYREGSAIHSKCTAFYDKQTFTNRRNIVLAIGVSVLAVFIFEEECDCFLGPDRGTKFGK